MKARAVSQPDAPAARRVAADRFAENADVIVYQILTRLDEAGARDLLNACR
ncbi:MAG TPA: hypothetical protein VGM03_23265 [Phycisphaerae bacterium]